MSAKKLLYIFIFLALVPLSAHAHVGYVLNDQELADSKGLDWGFVFSVLNNGINLIVMGVTLLFVALLLMYWKHIPLLKKEIKNIKKTLESYNEFIPWILRLSLGIALIGAGASEVLLSPALSGYASLATLQIFIGFLLLAGFLLPFATIAALLIGLYGIYEDVYLLGNIDFLMGALALFILADARPGLDDIIGIPFASFLKKLKEYVPFILRVGVGGAMTYLAIYEKFLNPHASALVITNYGLTNVIPVSPEMWVFSAGAVELLVGLLILTGLRTRLVSAIAFLVLSLSFFYFGEDVYSHITLFGILSAIFVLGGGKWSIDAWIKSK
ncbi:hypothetical protein CL654_03030 [bacterium]|nr:hypothetical protein [bacterium]|tara:strand:+ start:7840 stop:8823 length:984 start_codon:yes stop_codon:yes gene_type:complete